MGVTSFTMSMACPGVLHSDDGQILRALRRGAADGALTMTHAENGIAIGVLVGRAPAEGRTGPRYHGIDAYGRHSVPAVP